MLLDTGSSHTMIKRTSLPHGTTLTPNIPKRTTTTNGTFSTTSQVTLSKVRFLELGNLCIDSMVANVYHSPTCHYDLIVGRDVLNKIGIKIDFHTHVITWIDRDLSVRDPCNINTPLADMSEQHFLQEEVEDSALLFEVYTDDIIIKDCKYQAVSPVEVVEQLNHLNHHQKKQL